MKKILIIGTLALLALSTLVYTGCKKPAPYITPPVIALLGPNPYYLSLDSTYKEYGAIAHDDKDGDITTSLSWSGGDTIQTLNRATYYVTYKVTNATGYTTTVQRKVIVINNADFLAGKYMENNICAINGNYSDSAIVNVLDTNDKLTITNFGGFGSSVVITGTLQHIIDTIYFAPNQSLGGGRNLVRAYGVVVNVDTSFIDPNAVAHNINVHYLWTVGGNVDSCDAVYSGKH